MILLKKSQNYQKPLSATIITDNLEASNNQVKFIYTIENCLSYKSKIKEYINLCH